MTQFKHYHIKFLDKSKEKPSPEEYNDVMHQTEFLKFTRGHFLDFIIEIELIIDIIIENYMLHKKSKLKGVFRKNITNNKNITLKQKIEQLEEKYYQKMIHRNFKKIFPELEYFDLEHQNNHEGHYDCEVGTMDFLCKDGRGDLVVIELKLEGSDKSLGQICRYMGWVKDNLCESGQKIKGIIVSENNDSQLDYAIKVVPNIDFKRMWLEVKIVNWK